MLYRHLLPFSSRKQLHHVFTAEYKSKPELFGMPVGSHH